MTTDAFPRRDSRWLGFYRDPVALVVAIETHEALARQTGLFVELAFEVRLREQRLWQRFNRPVLHAAIRGRCRERVLAVVEASARRIIGPVVYLCHVDDAAHFGDVLSMVRAAWLIDEQADVHLLRVR